MKSDGRRLYNSRIIDNYIRLIERKYPQIRVATLLDYAGMTAHEVADEGHWFTQDQIDRFHEKLSFLTSNASMPSASSCSGVGCSRWPVVSTIGSSGCTANASRLSGCLRIRRGWDDHCIVGRAALRN